MTATSARNRVTAFAISLAALAYVQRVAIFWLPSYLREARHLTGVQTAGFAMLPLLFGGFGSLVAGFTAARFPQRRIAFLGFLSSAVLLFAVTRIVSTPWAMLAMGLASFCSDLTMPISWNACVEIGRRHTATLSGAMNMFGNLAGFVAPVGGGLILARGAGDWNVLIYLMVVASLVAALCWIFLDPGKPTDPVTMVPAAASPRA